MQPFNANVRTTPADILKAQPTPGDVLVNRPLTNISLAYFQDTESFIADRFFLQLPVQLPAGQVWEWDKTFMLRNEVTTRATNAETAGVGMKVGKLSYSCPVYGIHHDIEEQRSASEEDPINSDEAAVLLLSQQSLQFREIMFASKVFAGSTWTGGVDKTGVAAAPAANQFLQWSVATADPVKDVAAWSTEVKLNSGIRPNVLAIGRQVWDALKTCPAILDRIKYGQSGNANPALVTRQAVAQMFEVDEILISDVTQVTSAEGAASATYAFVIGKQAVLAYRPRMAAKNMPAAGYTFTWTGYLGATLNGARVKRFYLPQIASWRLEMEQAFDQKILAPGLGIYASAVVA